MCVCVNVLAQCGVCVVPCVHSPTSACAVVVCVCAACVAVCSFSLHCSVCLCLCTQVDVLRSRAAAAEVSTALHKMCVAVCSVKCVKCVK